MNPADIEATFTKPHRLPEPIVAVCRFLEQHGYPISGCFELSTIGMDDMRAWFRDSPSAVDQVLPFGRGACGEVYALWLTEGLSPDHAPVVLFGSEGELDVLAQDADAFCRLLCLGYSEIGAEDPSEPPSEFAETEPFRQYMLQRHAYQLPATAAPIVAEARKRFPDFAAWVASHQS